MPLVGGKNASLGEMYCELAAQSVKVPNGFPITADAYRHFLREAGVDRQIEQVLEDIDTRDIDNLRSRASQVRHAILAATLPDDLESAIAQAYDGLRSGDVEPPDVAVRSSAAAEDLPNSSFAGQQESYLNVQGSRASSRSARPRLAGWEMRRSVIVSSSSMATSKSSPADRCSF